MQIKHPVGGCVTFDIEKSQLEDKFPKEDFTLVEYDFAQNRAEEVHAFAQYKNQQQNHAGLAY